MTFNELIKEHNEMIEKHKRIYEYIVECEHKVDPLVIDQLIAMNEYIRVLQKLIDKAK